MVTKKNFSFFFKLTFPTDGNPIIATRASPDFSTSNPSPDSPFFPVGSNNSERYLANFAFKVPRWYSVAMWIIIIINGNKLEFFKVI